MSTTPATPADLFRYFAMNPPARVAAIRECQQEQQTAQASGTTLSIDEQIRCAAAMRAQKAAIGRGKPQPKHTP